MRPKSPPLVIIEEAMDCRDAKMRYFRHTIVKNHISLILSKNSVLTSCQLHGHEIVIEESQCKHKHETWAISDRPLHKMNAMTWNCHVRGNELHLTSNNGTIIYQLHTSNELRMQTKLKSIYFQQPVIYFNLNNAKLKVPIDGHKLLIQCNGSLSRIETTNATLRCQCNTKASIIAKSLIGEVPLELLRNCTPLNELANANNQQTANDTLCKLTPDEDDLIVTDAIFSLESTSQNDYLRAQLQFGMRGIQIDVRPSQGINQNNNTNQNNANNSSNNNTTGGASNQQKQSVTTILRLRVRVTNFGVCIMPIMMSNFCVSYKFYW